MASTTPKLSHTQWESCWSLWSYFGLQSDGVSVKLTGDLSIALEDVERNRCFRYHWKVVKGIKPAALQVLIQDFEGMGDALNASNHQEATLGTNTATELTTPTHAQGTSNMEVVSNIETSACAKSSVPPALELSVPPAPSRRSAKRPRLEEENNVGGSGASAEVRHTRQPAKRRRCEETNNVSQSVKSSADGSRGRCPGGKNDKGCCKLDSDKRWGQRGVFMEHFEDEHMSSHKVKPVRKERTKPNKTDSTEDTDDTDRSDDEVPKADAHYLCQYDKHLLGGAKVQCGEIFSKTKKGRTSFSEHTWAEHRIMD